MCEPENNEVQIILMPLDKPQRCFGGKQLKPGLKEILRKLHQGEHFGLAVVSISEFYSKSSNRNSEYLIRD